MAARLRRSLGIDAEVVPDVGGVFDVIVDDRLVFSKHEAGRFPNFKEIVHLINDRAF